MNEQFTRQAQEMFNAAKDVRIPENVQAFAEESVAKTREAFSRMNATAKDNAKKGGNTTTTAPTAFTVATGGGGGGGSTVTNDEWLTPGDLQTAAGRIYFEMPSNTTHTRWAGYVCSGTVATDATGGRSVILTAAHCVYDDVYKAFARNVNRDDIVNGAADLGVDLDQHIQFVIEAMQEHADALGLRGTA